MADMFAVNSQWFHCVETQPNFCLKYKKKQKQKKVAYSQVFVTRMTDYRTNGVIYYGFIFGDPTKF